MSVKTRLLTCVLGLLLAVSASGMGVEATNVVEIPATEVDSVYNLGVDSNELENWPSGPHIYSEAGIVMDIDSGAILYAKNIDDKHYPASITKVATALVALQNYQMDETVTFTWDDIGFLEYGDAHIGIKDGESISMEDAMYGMLLASANEVSHAIGAHMEGGYDAFIKLMNETTKSLGCTNTNWVNTYGLHDPEHYTSARDMALISSAVFQYEEFREITGTYQHIIPETEMTAEKRYVHQNHKMIREWDNRYYEHCVGGKTGYTDQALSTLVTFATKDGVNLVAVVLRTHGGGNNVYSDTRAMLDYAFENFSKLPVTDEMIEEVAVAEVETTAHLMLPEGVLPEQLVSTFIAPTELDDRTGMVAFTYDGQEVGTVDVTITDEYYNEIHGIEEEEGTQEERQRSGSPLSVLLTIFLMILGIIAVVLVALVIFVYYRRKQIEKRRRQRRLERQRLRKMEMRDF